MNPTTTRIAPVDAKVAPGLRADRLRRLHQPEHKAAFEAALAQVRAELGVSSRS